MSSRHILLVIFNDTTAMKTHLKRFLVFYEQLTKTKCHKTVAATAAAAIN